MDWSKGFSARYYMTLVDPETWRDIERLNITGGTIKRSTGELRQSADITVKNYEEDNERLIRVWLEATQKGSSSRTALFTGYAESPERDIDGQLVSHNLQCYSVLKSAVDVLLPRGWYAPVGINVIWQVRELLKATKAPVEVTAPSGDLTLRQALVAEQNETNLSMADLLLGSIGWRMTIDGFGRIYLGPKATEPAAVFDARDNDIVEPKLKDNNDWYGCPNVLRVVMDGTYAEARDEDPRSKFSIPNRGREVWAEETSVVLNVRETLSEYAQRRLKELQQVGRKVDYDRRYRPDLNVSDIVLLNYPAQKIVGNFMIQDQSIKLGAGAKVSEEVMQI